MAKTAVEHDVFISYSSLDKSFARRVSRRLSAYGMKVWLDEAQLEPGDLLPALFKQRIETSRYLVVVASHSALKSTWVAQEREFALAAGRPVIPLFVDPIENEPQVRDLLGLDFKSPFVVDRQLDTLGCWLLGRPAPAIPEHAFEQMRRAVVKVAPTLAPLIDNLVEGSGIPLTQMPGFVDSMVSLHDLEDALLIAYELAPPAHRPKVASAAGYIFSHRSAGSSILKREVASGAADETSTRMVIFNVVSRPLEAAQIDVAFELMEAAPKAADAHFADFLTANGARLVDAQKQRAVRYITTPDRGPSGMTDAAAFAALKHMPERHELRNLWTTWLQAGFFDGGDAPEVQGPRDLANWLRAAAEAKLECWKEIEKNYLLYVGSMATSGDSRKVRAAVDHMAACFDQKWARAREVADQLDAAIGSFEWNQWRDDLTKDFCREMHQRAYGDQNWSAARSADMERKKRLWSSEREPH